MIQIIVLIEIKDVVKFKQFETMAIKIIEKHEGKLLSAFEPNEIESTLPNIDEVHYLQFPDISSFKNYQNDAELKSLADLRNKAILKTTVVVSGKAIVY